MALKDKMIMSDDPDTSLLTLLWVKMTNLFSRPVLVKQV